MRIRIVAAVAAAAIAVTSLSACRTNVGFAADIAGTRYTESDVSGYLTPDAQPVSRQDSTGAQVSVATRSFVVETLIGTSLLTAVARALPGGVPSSAMLAQLRTSVLQGSSVDSAVRKAGIRGYTRRFDELLVRRVLLSQYLQSASQQGVDVTGALKRVSFPVSVNPRYGSWDATTRSFDSSDGAGAPTFLTLRPTTGSSTATAGG